MMRGTVVNLQLVARHGERPRAVVEVRALVDHGLEGDIHGKTKPGSRRQVLLADRGTLEGLGLRPGDLRDQITVDLAVLERLPAGTRLQVGEATLELSGPCEPCTHIGALNGVSDPVAFQERLRGRRGQLARVVAVEGAGAIRVGDPVVVQDPVPR